MDGHFRRAGGWCGQPGLPPGSLGGIHRKGGLAPAGLTSEGVVNGGKDQQVRAADSLDLSILRGAPQEQGAHSL